MPLLGATEALPGRPSRVLVAGAPGAGKTTLAAEVARVLHLDHTDIDGLFHGPGWTRLESFESEVDRATAGSGWVTEWMYSDVRAMLAERADTLIWLDLRRHVVMRRLALRTLRRSVRRTSLWNGNVEPALHTIFTDHDHIVRWGWRTYPRIGPRVLTLVAERPQLVVVRLRRPVEVTRWVRGPLQAAAPTRSRRPSP